MSKRISKLCAWSFFYFGFLVSLWAQTSERQFSMPSPKYEVRLEKSVMVPMRDGVQLSTDIYFPEGAGEKFPVIYALTPYSKNMLRDNPVIKMFAGQGYVVMVQDFRGKFESEGKYMVSAAAANDGYDTVTWAATQPWSNGNVGTYGCSYLGENQILQAKLKNPHLKAMIPQAAGGACGSAGNRYKLFGVRTGGAFELAASVGWFFRNGCKIYFRPPPGTPRTAFLEIAHFFNPAPVLPDVNFQELVWSLPIIDILKKAGAPPTDYEEFASHEPADPWWDQFGYIKDSDSFDVPALHVNSWYDYGVAETLYLFDLFRKNAISTRGRDNQFVIISPTGHCASERATEQTIVGERNVGDARFDYWGIYLRWFDYWLKGIENGITAMPKVQIYVMGRGEWKRENEWPLPQTKFVRYYFHSDGHANSRFGTGVLSVEKPGNEPPDNFIYDPKTPVPSVGGQGLGADGAFDQSEVETRHDVLVYTSPELKKGLEVTGPLKVVLYVSSSAKDTDFTAKLVDVYPDGTAYNIQEGILRARYREGFDKKVWMKPGDVFELAIDLQATSNYFRPGHRLRIEISSSNFPRFDRNLNTGGNNYDETEWIIAKNTIHHSTQYPSHIVLPIIE